MKKLKYIGILFLLILFSCVDDESRYGDIDIDEIKIEGIKDYQEIEVGGKLTIAPVVTTKFGENSDLSYVWYKYNEEQSVADTLSFEKNLDVVISDVLPGVKTTLKFKVTDNKTGVYVIEESSFTTNGKYSGGTLMLCKTGGEYDLTMLKKDGTTLYEKIYTQINEGEKLSEQSRKIILIKPYARNPRPYKAVVVTAKNNTGGVYLDPDLFVRKAYMKEKFFSGEDLTGDIGIDGYCTDQGSDYLVVNGKVHGRAYGFEETAVWNPEIVFLSAPQDYSAALYVAQPTGYPFYAAPLFYDNLHGRFMINQSGGYFSFIGGANSDFSKFDPKAMGEGVELVLSGSMNSTLNEVWALMRDKNKNKYIYSSEAKNKAQKENKCNNNTNALEEKIKALESKIEAIESKLNNKDKEFNAIEIKKFDGKTVSRCYRVYEDIQKEFSTFCKENSNYKVQDILSMALYEYMKNNKKDN